MEVPPKSFKCDLKRPKKNIKKYLENILISYYNSLMY